MNKWSDFVLIQKEAGKGPNASLKNIYKIAQLRNKKENIEE